MRKTYKAFISYSHADSEFAEWLHGSLEKWSLSKQLIQLTSNSGERIRNLRPIFLDRHEFSGGEELDEATLSALSTSSALIVLCSPNSCKSSYVEKEIAQFKSVNPERRIIPVIVPGYKEPPEDCFPASLRDRQDNEIVTGNDSYALIAADFRLVGDGKQKGLIKIVAGLLNLGFDDVLRRNEIARRKRMSMFAGAGVGAVIFAIAFSSFALYRTYQSDQVIEKSLFSISSLIDTTDRLIEDSDIESIRSSMLRAQCDIQQGLVENISVIDKRSFLICLMEQVYSLIELDQHSHGKSMLKKWIDSSFNPESFNEDVDQREAEIYINAIFELYKVESDIGDLQAVSEQLELVLNKTDEIGRLLPRSMSIAGTSKLVFNIHKDALTFVESWKELKLLYEKTISLRKLQSPVYEDIGYNWIGLDIANLLRELSVLEATYFGNRDAALDLAEEAFQYIPDSGEPDLGQQYEEIMVVRTLASAQHDSGALLGALNSYKEAKKRLRIMVANPQINSDQAAYLDGELRLVDQAISVLENEDYVRNFQSSLH